MRVAGVQMDVVLGDIEGNLRRMTERVREACANGAELVVFPECAVTGYCFDSREQALPYSQEIPGPAVETLARLAGELDCGIVFGLLERSEEQLFNAAVLVDGSGLLGSYRKVHLPWLGVDRYVDYGDRPFDIVTFRGVRLGLNICYDAGFPEPARCLALLGADVIVLPTNWPPGGSAASEYAINTRALENTIYYVAVDRIGVEKGCEFIGQSRICDPLGRTLAHAAHARDAIIYADVNPDLSRNKHLVRTPGTNEVNRIADRRPEMYGQIVQPHSLVRPGHR